MSEGYQRLFYVILEDTPQKIMFFFLAYSPCSAMNCMIQPRAMFQPGLNNDSTAAEDSPVVRRTDRGWVGGGVALVLVREPLPHVQPMCTHVLVARIFRHTVRFPLNSCTLRTGRLAFRIIGRTHRRTKLSYFFWEEWTRLPINGTSETIRPGTSTFLTTPSAMQQLLFNTKQNYALENNYRGGSSDVTLGEFPRYSLPAGAENKDI